MQWPVTTSTFGMINVCWGKQISGWGNTFPVTPAASHCKHITLFWDKCPPKEIKRSIWFNAGRSLFQKFSCCYYDKYWNILLDYNIDSICDHFLCHGSLSFSIGAQRRINSLSHCISGQNFTGKRGTVSGPYAPASVHCTSNSPHKKSPLFVMRS